MAVALGLVGWWWGSARLDLLAHSVLLQQVDRAERSILIVTGPPRVGRFTVRLPVQVRRFGRLRLREAAELQLPRGRAPPTQGAVLELVAEVRLPRGPAHGFDEKTWLRRHGVHVVLHASRWSVIGHRHGLAAIPDLVRGSLASAIGNGLNGERRAVVEGVVLGDEQGLSPELKARFRASGLYHLLAVSGQNVALVAGGILVVAWLLGVARWAGELCALAGIGAYVLAVGAQPSVIRAGVAGALTSLAWLTARAADRWYCLLLGALALLGWNPYLLLDAGFQLSFAAVAAIFALVPRVEEVLAGYPVPRRLADVVAISAACGAATAPILWLQFGAIPLLTVPANALAAPAVGPVLGLALAAAALQPIAPAAAAALVQVDGLCAAYLAGCARLVGGMPFAQARSPAAVAAVATGAVTVAAYAWLRWRT